MFGRSSAKQIDDQPGWREKLADLRDAPPWVLERPGWMTESPAALLLLFAGTLFALMSVLYLVVPADALPSSLPGRWSPPVTSSTVSTSTTTTTTLAPAAKLAILQKIAAQRRATVDKLLALPPAKRSEALKYIKVVAANKQQDLIAQQVLASPPVPPSRAWTYAFLAAVLAGGMLVAAWVVSDARGRLHFGK